MNTVYLICMLVGVIYAIIGFVLGGMGHAADQGGSGEFTHAYGAGGADHGHGASHGETSSGGQVVFGPLSPLVVAFFLTCFGGVGLLLTAGIVAVPTMLHLPIAVVTGVLLAWALFSTFNRMLLRLQGSSDVQLHTLIGSSAEVTVEIPAVGMGEIAFEAMGGRNNAPARSEDQQPIARHTAVRIARVVGNIFYVRPAVEEELRKLDSDVAAR